MGLPGHRRTSSHKRRRAAHFALKGVSVTTCEKCKSPVLPHRACKACGWYKGRVAVATADARLARHAKSVHALGRSPTGEAGHDHAHERAEAAPAAVAEKKAAVKKTAAKKPTAKKTNLKKMGSGDK